MSAPATLADLGASVLSNGKPCSLYAFSLRVERAGVPLGRLCDVLEAMEKAKMITWTDGNHLRLDRVAK